MLCSEHVLDESNQAALMAAGTGMGDPIVDEAYGETLLFAGQLAEGGVGGFERRHMSADPASNVGRFAD